MIIVQGYRKVSDTSRVPCEYLLKEGRKERTRVFLVATKKSPGGRVHIETLRVSETGMLK